MEKTCIEEALYRYIETDVYANVLITKCMHQDETLELPDELNFNRSAL